MAVASAATNTVTSTVGAGNGPFGVAVTSSGTVYLTNYSGGTVSVFTTSTSTPGGNGGNGGNAGTAGLGGSGGAGGSPGGTSGTSGLNGAV